jgi:hypothetical protein
MKDPQEILDAITDVVLKYRPNKKKKKKRKKPKAARPVSH